MAAKENGMRLNRYKREWEGGGEWICRFTSDWLNVEQSKRREFFVESLRMQYWMFCIFVTELNAKSTIHYLHKFIDHQKYALNHLLCRKKNKSRVIGSKRLIERYISTKSYCMRVKFIQHLFLLLHFETMLKKFYQNHQTMISVKLGMRLNQWTFSL